MDKFIIFTDMHLHGWQEFASQDQRFITTRFKDQIDVLREVFKLAQEEKATLLFGGDLFHKRGSVDTRIINETINVFKEFEDVPFLGISGNHDKVSNKLEASSSLDIFKFLPNNTIISDKVSTVTIGETQIVCIPYGDEVEQIKESLQEQVDKLDTSKPTLLLGHIGVDGAMTGRGNHRLAGAFSYHELHPKTFDGLYLGHYHKPQTLGNNPNHQYIGSTMQYSFNEEGQRTGVLLVTTDGKDISTEFKEIESTKFLTVDKDNLQEITQEDLDNHYIRFKGNREQAQHLEQLAEKENKDLSNMRVVVEEEFETETRIDIENSTDPKVVTQKYMEQYYPKAVDEALECLKEVL